ncbi:MAG: hypothetical protein KatS3mg114_0431 [Planctomycetaceae bacterium]|nr:MAG: hypothetical protein KatS3mg114_0431 [Planctomycetaceae bacterium]
MINAYRSLSRVIITCGLWWETTIGLPADRYLACLEDGSLLTAEEIRDWNEPDATPTFAGHPLFDATRPVLWWCDQLADPLGEPTAYVELRGGDRLAGEVLGYLSGSENAWEPHPRAWLVRVSGDAGPPDTPGPYLVRVRTDAVHRIVLSPSSGRGSMETREGGWLQLRDGATFGFTNWRWQDGRMSLLTRSGLKTVPWSEVHQVVFPDVDPWQHYGWELQQTQLGSMDRLMQWWTQEGHRLTVTSLTARYRHWGDKQRPEAWLHVLQPSWALDPLWIRFRSTIRWLSWSSNEPPLTRFGRGNIERESVLSGSWLVMQDLSLTGGPLLAGKQRCGWGWSAFATTRWNFPIPPEASALKLRVGLDPTMQDGGCVQFRIRVDNSQIWESGILTGRDNSWLGGWISLPPAESSSASFRTLQIEADMVKQPPRDEWDPLDIRDLVCVGDVQVRLAPQFRERLASQQLTQHSPQGVINWQPAVTTFPAWDETDPRRPRCKTLLRFDAPATWHDFHSPTESVHWLGLAVCRWPSHPAVKLRVTINQQEGADFDVPVRQGPLDPDPLVIPLPESSHGYDISITVLPSELPGWLEWRGIVLQHHRPGIVMLFDEPAPSSLQLAFDGSPADSQPVSSAPTASFHGATQLALKGHRVVRLNVSTPWPWTIRELPALGEYRYLIWAWRGEQLDALRLGVIPEPQEATQQQGYEMVLGSGSRPRSRHEARGWRYGYRYEVGSPAMSEMSITPLRLDRKISTEWKLEVRDLFADFGPCLLYGVECQTVGSGQGMFDAIYLARTPRDVEWLRQILMNARRMP